MALFLSLVIYLSAVGQYQNIGKTDGSSSARPKDSAEFITFQRLVQFISVHDLNIQAKEGLNDSLSHFGEEHQLVAQIQNFPVIGSQMAGSFSYDNFMPTVHNKEALQGSPFLLSTFVPGLVVNDQHSVIDQANFLYNYDKISGNFLMQRDMGEPIAVKKDQVRFFCLKLATGGYIFERVSLIDPDKFFQILYRGPRYSCYKLYKSKFVPAGQKTDGYVTVGNNYDEYQDIFVYYLLDREKGEALIFELTKKSIRKALSSESVTVEQYIKSHKSEDVNESYIVHLLEKLPQ